MTKAFYRNIPVYFYPEDDNVLIGRNLFFDILLDIAMWWDVKVMLDPKNHIKPDFDDNDPFEGALVLA